MSIDIQSPRRDEKALDGDVFALRVINFFEDIVTILKDQAEQIENMQEILEDHEQRITTLEGYH